MIMNSIVPDYGGLEFNDQDDYAPDTQICPFCWSKSDERIGYNEKENLLKRACLNCGAIYIEDDEGKVTVLKGEKRDWMTFLSQNLVFPFEAIVEDVEGNDGDAEHFGYENLYPFRCQDRVKVLDTDFEDDLCGIIAGVRKGRKKYAIPLCDLSVADKTSNNHKLVDAYQTWFFNYR